MVRPPHAGQCVAVDRHAIMHTAPIHPPTHQFLLATTFWRPGNLNLARRRASAAWATTAADNRQHIGAECMSQGEVCCSNVS